MVVRNLSVVIAIIQCASSTDSLPNFQWQGKRAVAKTQ